MTIYAKGRKAVGVCARSGRKMLLSDMVPDGYKKGLMVDPAWRDTAHPAEKPVKTEEGIALKKPAPDIDDDTGGAGGTLASLFDANSYFGGGT